MPKAFLVVRVAVADPQKRAAFDAWYRDEHLPQAMAAFGAEKGWRFWSVTDPAAHQATYQFPDRAAAERVLTSDGLKRMSDEFDRVWPGIPRAREVFVLVDERDGG